MLNVMDPLKGYFGIDNGCYTRFQARVNYHTETPFQGGHHIVTSGVCQECISLTINSNDRCGSNPFVTNPLH